MMKELKMKNYLKVNGSTRNNIFFMINDNAPSEEFLTRKHLYAYVQLAYIYSENTATHKTSRIEPNATKILM